MADTNFINNKFQQEPGSNVCAMASYSLVIEYFSDQNLKIEQVLSKYIQYFKIYVQSKKGNYIFKKHKAVSDHFHYDYCFPKRLSGFDFISQLHNNDWLGTKKYCEIVSTKFTDILVGSDQIELIRNELTKNDSLAIILYKTDSGNLHAETIGFDEELNGYFHKDPEKSQYLWEDILSNKEITEFIIFRTNQN